MYKLQRFLWGPGGNWVKTLLTLAEMSFYLVPRKKIPRKFSKIEMR